MPKSKNKNKRHKKKQNFTNLESTPLKENKSSTKAPTQKDKDCKQYLLKNTLHQNIARLSLQCLPSIFCDKFNFVHDSQSEAHVMVIRILRLAGDLYYEIQSSIAKHNYEEAMEFHHFMNLKSIAGF